MRLVYITLARKILCYGSFPAKVSLGTNAYNFLKHNEIIHYYSGKMNLCQSVYKSDKEISLNE